ncbi:hypothetical protein NQ166_00750 [Microbacterium sp. zg.Y1090]|uniref:hypothetical protein n=1 Tax=Microbacterium TaxID=33882 RepID=UPI00214B5CEC|nr:MULTISPECIES: hypothetical protein [unclassified Microbacterium]MCR2812840.1 hypothetical protein [Microbacterium sp. zg.Y1084]MCR2817357.1 hypothetical protein [Microbacterium sp. zg.Y1090]WIM29156.1 hypothetical protein QNO26_04460 [Microbacterium sp. zg-Y1090]
MSHHTLLLGDTETPLARGMTALDTARRSSGAAALSAPRAVLAFADLRDDTRRSGPERLRTLAALSLTAAARQPSVRHLIFAVMLAPRHAGRFDRIASALGARLHSDLERDRGRDVEVTFLDVSDCTDVPGLTERLLDRCDDPAGLHGVVVLDWADIRERSIAYAARTEYL